MYTFMLSVLSDCREVTAASTLHPLPDVWLQSPTQTRLTGYAANRLKHVAALMLQLQKARKKRKQNTMVIRMLEEKFMVDLSFPLAAKSCSTSYWLQQALLHGCRKPKSSRL